MDKNFHELANSLVSLQKEAVKQTLSVCEPVVDRIISSGSTDKNAIERTLDALCEVAFDEKVLIIFKELCRYYYNIDPVATAQQINFYREMWDNDDDENFEL